MVVTLILSMAYHKIKGTLNSQETWFCLSKVYTTLKEDGFTFYQQMDLFVSAYNIPDHLLDHNIDQTHPTFCIVSDYTLPQKGDKSL